MSELDPFISHKDDDILEEHNWGEAFKLTSKSNRIMTQFGTIVLCLII